MEITLVQIMGVLLTTLLFTLLLGWVLFRKLRAVQLALQNNLEEMNQALEVQRQTVNDVSEKATKTLSSEITMASDSINHAINQSVQQTVGELKAFREAVSRQFGQTQAVQESSIQAAEQSLKDSVESNAFAALVEIKNLAEHIETQIDQSYTELDRSHHQFSHDLKNHLGQLVLELNNVIKQEIQQGKDALAEKMHNESSAMNETFASVTSEASETVLEKIVGNSQDVKQGTKEITFGLSRLKSEIMNSNSQSVSSLKESTNALKDNVEKANTAVSGIVLTLARQNKQSQREHNEVKESLDAVKTGIFQAVQSAVVDEIGSINSQQERRYSALHDSLEKTNMVVKNAIESTEQQLKSSVSQITSEQSAQLKDSLQNMTEFLSQNTTRTASETAEKIANVVDQLSTVVERNKQELLESHREDTTWQKRATSIVRKEIETAHTVYKDFTSRFDSLERDIQGAASFHEGTRQKLASLSKKLDSILNNWTEMLPESQTEAYLKIKEELEHKVLELKALIEKSIAENTQSLHGAINDLSQPAIDYTKYQASASELTSSLQDLIASDELVVSVDGINQYFGGLRLEKLEDESLNLVTNFFYQEGKKISSDTLSEGRLKYRMLFDNEKPSKGFEFDSDGNTIHEYEYDPAGEVLSRTDFSPDGSVKNVVNY